MGAPKKFTDASRSEITPEWKEYYERVLADAQEEMEDIIVSTYREDPQNRWPERYDKDLGDGDWIFVVEEPVTEVKQRFSVPTPSLWWARPAEDRPHGIKMKRLGTDLLIPGPYRAVIETPGGSLWLYPHEYVVCKDPLPLLTDPECTLHPLGGQPSLDEEQREQMFYLQSRGWTRTEAMLALMEGLDMRDWGWLEFPEYAREMFAGVGARVRLGA